MGLATAFCVVLVCVVVYWLRRPSEPVYQGKTAAEWFKEFETAYSRSFVAPSSGFRASILPGTGTRLSAVRFLDEQALLRDPSAAGLRGLGTNAAVYLGRKFAAENGPAARRYMRVYLRLPAFLKRWLPQPLRHSIQLEIALRALGNDAAAGVPALLESLGGSQPGLPPAALGVLSRLSFDRHLMDPILSEWSRGKDEANVLAAVTIVQVHTKTAAECLARILTSQQPALRQSAVFELEKCGPDAAVAVPALLKAMSDPDEEVRYGAARALGAIGTPAAPAAATLMQATNQDSSVMVQRAAARALKAIQGQNRTGASPGRNY